MKDFPMIDPSMSVSEWELRGCFKCDPDKHLTKYGNVDGLTFVHVLLHDRAAACERANGWARSWNESVARGLAREGEQRSEVKP